ncbi:MAG: hypothetical protein KatS3mg105_0013 [Gemmatales bacterium]|nr:MAG: hypothetical protein KatS3mg105_0013 [Gemmatales bacterium]
MIDQKVTCPECRLSFKPKSSDAVVVCPICDTQVPVPETAERLQKAPVIYHHSSVQPPPKRVVTSDQLVNTNSFHQSETAKIPAANDGKRRNVLLAAVAAGLVFLLLTGASLGVFVWSAMKEEKNADETLTGITRRPPVEKGPRSNREPGSQTVPSENQDHGSSQTNQREPEPPSRRRIPSALENQVNKAIDKGVRYLKGRLADTLDGTLTAKSYPLGFNALLAWTLLECGVSPDDPLIQKIAVQLRSNVDEVNKNYCAALLILFFDRLREERDRGLIRTLALRLAASQLSSGGWSYECSSLSKSDEDILIEYLRSITYVASGDRPRREVHLPDHLKRLAVVRAREDRRVRLFNDDRSDNSNTQFAVLALWVAYRQGIPLQPSLALLGKYFRKSQNRDGSWGYRPGSSQWRDSMTCSGLLGLAVDQSVQAGKQDRGQQKDEAIEKAFQFVSGTIGRKPPTGKLVGADALGDLYYLWSLERVAMIYDLDTIQGKDWYKWGAEILLKAQKADGSWSERFPPEIDTCFALLVLKRVNVVKDLTDNIKQLVDIKNVR